MFKRIAAFILCVLMIAGCGAKQTPASSAPQAAEQQTGGYKNPDPDMVMATTPNGDITYKDYRLYVDVSESIARFNARQNAAVVAVLEHDLAEMGIEIDDQQFNAQADANVETMRKYYSDFETELAMLAELGGITEEQAIKAIKCGFRSEFLVEKMGAALEAQAAEEYVIPDGMLNDSGMAASDIELLKLQGIYQLAQQKMNDYSNKMQTRIKMGEGNILIVLDGTEIPLDDASSGFIEYSAAASRLDSADFIMQGELMLKALEDRGVKLDIDAIMADHAAYIQQFKSNSAQVENLSELCAPFGASIDDYFEALKRPIIIESATNRFYEVIDEEYAKMVEENTNDSGAVAADLPSPDQYYLAEMEKLMENSKIVNATGK